MKLKRDESGNVVATDDGKVVLVKDDGEEVSVDPANLYSTVGQVRSESIKRKEKIREMEAKMKAFGDIDPDEARQAIEAMKSGGKGADKEALERVRQETMKAAKEQYEAALKEAKEQAAHIERQFHSALLRSAFSGSEFVQQRLVLPPDLAMKAFADHFAIEDGNVVAKDQHGNVIYSRSNPGATADFDEAMQILVDQYPGKENILRAATKSGSGGTPPSGSNGKATITRSEFEQLDPDEKARIVERVKKGEMQLATD